MKICCTCKTEKTELYFCKCKSNKDGLSKQCKECEHERKRIKYYKNIEETRNKKKENASKNREKRNEKVRDNYYANLEESRQRSRDKYYKNREEILQKNKEKNHTPEQRKKLNERAKKWRSDQKELYNAYQRIYRRSNKLKIAAVQKVNDALRWGRLSKPLNCEICNVEGNMQGHHKDYTKPLEVQWLCRKCHCKQHNKLMDVL
jgi:hypothetical protein